MYPGNLNGYTSDQPDLYDCRRRVWYQISAASQKDVVIVIDTSGSMAGTNMGRKFKRSLKYAHIKRFFYVSFQYLYLINRQKTERNAKTCFYFKIKNKHFSESNIELS